MKINHRLFHLWFKGVYIIFLISTQLGLWVLVRTHNLEYSQSVFYAEI